MRFFMQDETIVIIHLKNKIKLRKKRFIYINKWSRRIIERPECKSCRFSCCFWIHIHHTHIYSLFSVAFFSVFCCWYFCSFDYFVWNIKCNGNERALSIFLCMRVSHVYSILQYIDIIQNEQYRLKEHDIIKWWTTKQQNNTFKLKERKMNRLYRFL